MDRRDTASMIRTRERTTELPEDPFAVTDSGNTRLELWLHEYAAMVETSRE